MRLMISALWSATQPSGICRTVVNLIRGIGEVRPETEVILVIGAWQRKYFDDSLGLASLKAQVIEIDIPNNSLARNAWYAFELPKLAQRTSADIVHLAFPAPIFRRLFSCPVVTTLHDLYPYDQPENFGFPRVLGNRLFLGRALQASDRVVCVSRFTLDRLHYFYPPIAAAKASWVPNAIFVCCAPSAAQTAIFGRYVLAVGQHRANKNIPLLIRSFHRYRLEVKSSHSLQLIIVGGRGPETARLRQLVERLSLHEDVLFIENLADAEMAALYADCEFFITLSSTEGFGLPVGEALSYAARVIASDIPPHREIGGAHCEYVALDSEDAIGAAVLAMKVAAAKSRPPRRTISQFTPQAVANGYLSIYEDLRNSSANSRALAVESQGATAVETR